jgi:hypothetical protein
MPMLPRDVTYVKFNTATSTFDGGPVTLSEIGFTFNTVPQISIDSNDKVHVAWQINDMVIGYRNKGVSWDSVEYAIDYTGANPVINISGPTLFVDDNDEPHIAVITSEDKLEYANKKTGSWISELTDHVGISGSPVMGIYGDIIYISYCIADGREEDEIEAIQCLPSFGWMAPDVIGAGYNPTLSITCGGEVYIVWSYLNGMVHIDTMVSKYDGSWTPPSHIEDIPFQSMLYSNNQPDILKTGYVFASSDGLGTAVYCTKSDDVDYSLCDSPSPEPDSEPEGSDRELNTLGNRKTLYFHTYKRRCC